MNNKYYFTKNWFVKSEIKQKILSIKEKYKINNILEIGSFEGGSACFFSDNLLDNSTSSLICVDPFIPSNTDKEITSRFVNYNTKNIFIENIKKSKNFDKIIFFHMKSDNFFLKNKNTFDLIYIDGCHEEKFIVNDIINSFKFINKNGIIWIDDYMGNTSNGKMKIYIDKILEKYKNKFIVIHKGYQIALHII